jgi:uncharacterized alkaline shock family protein YloU
MTAAHTDKPTGVIEPSLPEDSALLETTQIGEVIVSKSAIAAVVRKYALGVEGVSRLAPSRLVDGLADMLSKRNYERSIAIGFDGDMVVVDLIMIVNFGYKIVDVVKEVQNVVKDKIESLIGIKVKRVNVFVKELDELDFSDPAEEPDAEGTPQQ